MVRAYTERRQAQQPKLGTDQRQVFSLGVVKTAVPLERHMYVIANVQTYIRPGYSSMRAQVSLRKTVFPS